MSRLLHIPMFQTLSNMELSKLLGKLEKQQLPAQSTLFRQGDHGDSMYIVESGRVELFVDSPGGGRQLIAVLEEGSTLGEMALLTGDPRTATVVAAEDTMLYVIDWETLDRLVEEQPSISAYFIRLLSQRLVSTNERLQESKASKLQWVKRELEQLPEAVVACLLWAAHVPLFDSRLAQRAVGGAAAGLAEQLAALPANGPLLRKEVGQPGWYAVQHSARRVLQELAQAPDADRERWWREAALAYADAGRWDALCELYGERGEWERLIEALLAAERELLREQGRERSGAAEPRQARKLGQGLGRSGEQERRNRAHEQGAELEQGQGPEPGQVRKLGQGLEQGRKREAGQKPGTESPQERPLGELYAALRTCPPDALAAHAGRLSGFLADCAAAAPEAGLAVVEAILHRQSCAASELPRLYEWAAEFCRLLGMKQQMQEYMQLAEAAVSADSAGGDSGGLDDRRYGLQKQSLARRRSQSLAESAGRLLKRSRLTGLSAIVLALLCMLAFHVMEPFGGLSREAMDFIGIGAAAVIFWMVNIIPDYIVALGMAMLWVTGGLLEPEVALSGFASTTWLYMIFIMALSAVITKSGILYRFSLHALQRFPPHYRGQLWGIVTGGALLNPMIPSSSAKVSLGVPIAQTIAESMHFKERSGGAAGLGLAAMVFYGFTAPFVLTGSYTNVMAYGLTSANAPIGWLQWFINALPAFLIFSVVMLIWLSLLFRKTAAPRPVEAAVLKEQLALLGPLTKEERISVGTVLGAIALMIAQPLHGLDNAWVMLLAFAVLILTGVLDKKTIATGIDWTFLLFLGIAFSFAGASEQLGITEAIGSALAGPMSLFISSPVLFLTAVILISFLVTLVVRDDPAVILLVTALLPLAEQAGIHPWVLVFVVLLSTDPFFFSYQSPTYLTAYYSSEGKAFSHRQGQKVALGYALAVLAVAVLCIPYWQWLGLIK
ncbi:SLC13 family permease [Paenibacillus turpanensis]|uniref:SLC13 family permease n=1 Tax=Paenibacillus turpanensis TaxID=2689078 RepID=UPI001408C582|nr:SLC13 family permease [Paenibacillus turpanensis]